MVVLFDFLKRLLQNVMKHSVAILVVIVLIAVLSFPIYLGIQFGQLPSITEYWLQYLSIFLSSFSFVAVLITLWLQYKESKKQQVQIEKNFEFAQQNYNSQVLNKIHYFMSEDMEKCRSGCWLLWSKIKTERRTRSEIKKLFRKVLINNWGNEKKASETFNTELWDYFSSFYKLARYFDVLSHFKYDSLTANAIHYYYIFFRPLFIEMIALYNETYESIDKERLLVKSKEGWINLVEKYDKVMIANNLSIN